MPPASHQAALWAAWLPRGDGGQGTTGGGQVSYSLYRMFARQMFEQPEVLTGTKARINNQTYPGVCPHTFKYSVTCFKWNPNTEQDFDGNVGTLGPALRTDFELSA